ncbi:MAG: hypothetical protein IKN60_02015 [Bacteroidales bacterium]|nr:hypothetical protein [Bacteroidales bacterium]
MRPVSLGTRLFLSIFTIFLALVLAFVLYLHFDVQLSATLHDDAVFLWFVFVLAILLVAVLLWYSRKMNRIISRTSQAENALMRRQLTQNISHELKTPVSGIQGYLETVLQNPDLPEEKRRLFLERSLAQTQRLSALLRDLSVLNRMDDADAASLYPFRLVDVAETLDLLSRETAPAFAARRMKLRFQVPEMIDLNGNETLIYSIFRNLLDNALAYAGEGATVTLSARRDGPFWHFTYTDDGPGVPQEHLPRLFERFYRIDTGRSRATGGTGLGLSIVKNAILLHGGTITATSPAGPAGSGLRFDFTLHR